MWKRKMAVKRKTKDKNRTQQYQEKKTWVRKWRSQDKALPSDLKNNYIQLYSTLLRNFLCFFYDCVNKSDKRTCNVRTIGGRRTGKNLVRKWSWPKRGITKECSSRECILDSWWPGCNWKLAMPSNLLVRQHYYSLLCQLIVTYCVSSHCFCQFIFVWRYFKLSIVQCQVTW